MVQTGESPSSAPAAGDVPIAGERGSLIEQLERTRDLLLDSPDAVRGGLIEQLERTRGLLAGDPEAAAALAIQKLGASGEVEERIAVDLADPEVLALPAAFPAAHRRVMRAMEVLDRDGTRNPPLPRLGPLKPVAEIGVEYIAEYIVKSYLETVANRLRNLYTRREAQSAPRTPERLLLTRTRMEMDRLAPGYRGGGLGAPILILGGVAAPVFATLGRYFGAIPVGDRPFTLGLIAVLFLVALLVSSMLLSAAAVAHRRSRLAMEEPLLALWATIGHCGNPPRDDSVDFATIAIAITAIGWVVLPVVATLVYFLG